MGPDTLTMQLFSRFSVYASAAYCKMPASNSSKLDKEVKLAAKNSLIQSQLGLHPSKIYPYVGGGGSMGTSWLWMTNTAMLCSPSRERAI